MARDLTIMVVTDHSDLVEKTEAGVVQFSQVICRVSSYAVDVAENLAAEEPSDMVIFDVRATDVEHDLEVCTKLMRAMTQTMWVVTCEKSSSDLILRSLRMGAKDFLAQPWKQEELEAVIRRGIQHKMSQESAVQGHGKLITVFSNKGGVGTSTIACNLAAGLAATHPDRVLLCDMVLQHGDLLVFLDVKQKYTISNLVQEIDRLDREMLFNQLQKHNANLYVLPAPYVPDETAQIRPAALADAMDFLLSCFEFVVVDGGHEFTSQIVPVLNKSDIIYLVTVPDVPTIRNTKRCLNMFEQFGFPQERTKVIVNRFDAKQHVDLSSVQKDIDFPIAFELVNDYASVINAINQGRPVQQIAPKSKLAKQFQHLAQTCNGREAVPEKGMMSQLFGLDRKKEKKEFKEPKGKK